MRKVRTTMTLTQLLPLQKTDAAWIAGIIDGEGCLLIKTHLCKPGRSPWFGLCVQVKMTSKATINRLQELTGTGSITVEPNGRLKTGYRWTVSGLRAEELLLAVGDYMFTKRFEVMTALMFAETNRRTPGTGGRGKVLVPAAITQERYALKAQITEQKRAQW